MANDKKLVLFGLLWGFSAGIWFCLALLKFGDHDELRDHANEIIAACESELLLRNQMCKLTAVIYEEKSNEK